MQDYIKVINATIDMINHFKGVEENIISVSKDSSLRLANLIENGTIQANEEVVLALQYQDIVSQRLSATMEAMEETNKYLQQYAKDVLCTEEFLEHLSFTLQNAIKKQLAFEGNCDTDDSSEDDIFF